MFGLLMSSVDAPAGTFYWLSDVHMHFGSTKEHPWVLVHGWDSRREFGHAVPRSTSPPRSHQHVLVDPAHGTHLAEEDPCTLERDAWIKSEMRPVSLEALNAGRFICCAGDDNFVHKLQSFWESLT